MMMKLQASARWRRCNSICIKGDCIMSENSNPIEEIEKEIEETRRKAK
jgi:hypothetical protein